MPAYDYRCEPCAADFEARRPVADRATAVCPTCDAPAPERITAAPVVWSKFQGATARDRVRKDLTGRIAKGPR
jgi:putative FmdB family regulatory protein